MNDSAGTLIEVEHLTQYRYATPVELAHHLAYLQPADGDGQRVIDFRIEVDPEPTHHSSSIDAMGNRRHCFALNRQHRALDVRARSRVLMVPPPAFDASASAAWEAVRDRLRYAAGRPYEAANEFVHVSPYVPSLAALREWARSAFKPARPVAEVVLELMTRVHAEFTYRSASTEVDTPLAEVLARREGVCQDFAHLLIGALRSMGLAARYVSGYLLTAPPATQDGAAAPWLGADASHAWVALWCPMSDGGTARWLELDPTNNVVPSSGHVRLAVGRDYGDVTPLRGVIRGGGEHRLEVRVRTERVT